MIFSMTGYASATRELLPALAETASGTTPGGTAATGVAVEFRSVNSRFLDLSFRMPDELRSCEPALRESLMAALARGKVEVRINVQRPDGVASGVLDRAVLAQLVQLQQSVVDVFPDAQRLHVGEMLRWPGVIRDASVSAEQLRDAVLQCGQEALRDLLTSRAREGAALTAILLDLVSQMEAIVTGIAPLMPEMVARHQQKIRDRLQDALGVPGAVVTADELAERIRQEVTLYGVRIDIAEELARLSTHLSETRHILGAGGKVGKRLDFMMQELNREANTLGSKAAAKEMSDAAMALKLLIEQMREQVQNLE